MESSTDTKNIFALDARTGQLLWSAGPGYNTLNIPLTNALLLAAREHNGVYSLAGLESRTGKAAWQVPFQCAVYHLSNGATAWRHTMPPFPAPTSANTSPGTSQPVLAP